MQSFDIMSAFIRPSSFGGEYVSLGLRIPGSRELHNLMSSSETLLSFAKNVLVLADDKGHIKNAVRIEVADGTMVYSTESFKDKATGQDRIGYNAEVVTDSPWTIVGAAARGPSAIVDARKA